MEFDPGWGDYQDKTARVLPVVALTEIPGPPNVAAKSMGAALTAIHDVFRRELALVRKEITKTGRSLGAQLRVNPRRTPPRTGRPLARLRAEHQAIAEVESHLDYEETQLIPALDATTP